MGWEYDKERFHSCPSLLVEPWMVEYIDAYKHYKNGLFAVPGALEDQPVKYLDGIGIVDSEIMLIEKEALEEKNRS